MLSDACSDFNSEISDLVLDRIKPLKEPLDHYDDSFWGYHRGEIPAIRRAIAEFETDERLGPETMIALLRILDKVRQFHDTPPNIPLDENIEWQTSSLGLPIPS